MSVVLHIPVSDEILPLIDRRADAAGLDRESYLRDVITQQVIQTDRLDAILADVRAEFDASGMNEEDVAELVQTARREIWLEKQPVTS